MKKIITLIVTLIVFLNCGVKHTRSLLMDGDYDGAIQKAVSGLNGNKNAKGKQDYVYLLEEAFAKAKTRDLERVKALNKENNPNNFEKIYNGYLDLQNRQELIKPLLPLQLIAENRAAIFPMDDYTDEIIASKNNLSKYLYENSRALLTTKDKMTCRRAYDDLGYLDKINPDYKDVRKLMDEARLRGIDFVNVYTKNETNIVIPTRLQDDLLDFGTFGLNDKWTVYHSNKQKGLQYDFGMIINFRNINISPEQVKEKEFVKEKQIKDGTKPLLDANNNPVRDQAGVPIRIDNFKNIRVSVYEFRQLKTVNVVAKIDYIDLKTNQLIETFPLASEFVFENIYSTFNGDKNACEPDYFQYFDRRVMPFPSNEKMIYDCGEDLKKKLKEIIVRNKFRR
jgi:hypothetical protein